jgi:Protein of unknown function (DUF4197)
MAPAARQQEISMASVRTVLAAALVASLGLLAPAAGPAELPASVSNADAVGALRQALTQGAGAAVGKLGVADGYLGNPKVRIPLPPKLRKAEKLLRRTGFGSQLDGLVTTMNRAAEAAVPEAKALLVGSIRQMSVQDARQILTGSDDAATQYFKKVTREPLTTRFLPIVKKSTDQLGLATQYNQLAGQAVKYGVLSAEEATIEQYVTQKALDGLYVMIAEEERAIRKDPLGQASSLLQRVFGSIKP